MLTGILILWPLIASLCLLFIKSEDVKKVALVAALIELAISLYAAYAFTINGAVQFGFDFWWIESMGISFKVGMDGISLLLVLLTTFLTPVIIYSSFNKVYPSANVFYALILLMQMALVGVFVALDGFLFYIFWELALIPIYFICLMWGGLNRTKVTFKFFVYTLVGSLFMLVGFIYLYLQTPAPHTFNIEALYKAGASLNLTQQSLVFWAIFLAFAVKMPVFPFHTWQPDTYTEAPTQGTMLLSGIMLKMGIYGVIRWLIPVVPMGVKEWSDVAIILSVIGIVYASCIAIVQKDLKRLIAYSSIAHVGLISAGAFALNMQGLQGTMIQMLSHGINVVALFYIVDIFVSRSATRDIPSLGGIRSIAPVFATYFIIVILGTVALPLTNGFVGEFLLLNGLYQYSGVTAGFAGLTIILGPVYMFRTFQTTMLGETNAVTKNFTDLTFHEKAVLLPLATMIILIGVYPKPLLDIAEPALQLILDNYTNGLK